MLFYLHFVLYTSFMSLNIQQKLNYYPIKIELFLFCFYFIKKEAWGNLSLPYFFIICEYQILPNLFLISISTNWSSSYPLYKHFHVEKEQHTYLLTRDDESLILKKMKDLKNIFIEYTSYASYCWVSIYVYLATTKCVVRIIGVYLLYLQNWNSIT